MLKHTHVRFELLTDIDMAMFIERGIYAAVSVNVPDMYRLITNTCVHSKPSSYLMYYDVNNLYGWAMC